MHLPGQQDHFQPNFISLEQQVLLRCEAIDHAASEQTQQRSIKLEGCHSLTQTCHPLLVLEMTFDRTQKTPKPEQNCADRAENHRSASHKQSPQKFSKKSIRIVNAQCNKKSRCFTAKLRSHEKIKLKITTKVEVPTYLLFQAPSAARSLPCSPSPSLAC